MGIFDVFRKKNDKQSSAQIAKQRMLEILITHPVEEGNDPSELIKKIQIAVLKVLNEHYQANIDIGNVCTNLKKENDTTYIDLQVNLPDLGGEVKVSIPDNGAGGR
ncbi:MAG: hypothetical protein IJ523_04085 [Succinivibrionaceae bacterium]|nr:hypothetical protein [Succinivibrionaceae bacterium]